MEYLNKISPDTHPTPTCPLCHAHTHNTNHLFTWQHIHTTLNPISLWEDPVGAADLLARWSEDWSDRERSRSTETEKQRGRHNHLPSLDKVYDLTHFVFRTKKCRNFHSIVSLRRRFEIHNNNKLFSSMSQSQSIVWVKQKPDNNCLITRILTKNIVLFFLTLQVCKITIGNYWDGRTAEWHEHHLV